MRKVIVVYTLLVASVAAAQPAYCALTSYYGPVVINGQSGTVIENLKIVNPYGDCVTISASQYITIRNSEIGPCGGRGITVDGSYNVNIVDNYIHPEVQPAACCDTGDGIFVNGSYTTLIQGNIVAYGETNVAMKGGSGMTVYGNFLLNPLGNLTGPTGFRGSNFQAVSGSYILVQSNYALGSQDTGKYAYAEAQQDNFNFFESNNISVLYNYLRGGHSSYAGGITVDEGSWTLYIQNNTVIDSGSSGINLASGQYMYVAGNKVLNRGNSSIAWPIGIFVWNWYASQGLPVACGTITIENNIAASVSSGGDYYDSSYLNWGGCEPVTQSNNTFGQAAQAALEPIDTKYPAPSIPPVPYGCVAASPYSTQNSLATCHGDTIPPTLAINTPAEGAKVSGTIAITGSAADGVQLSGVAVSVDGSPYVSASGASSWTFSLNTTALANGAHAITVKAWDSSGNNTIAARNITVSNDVTPPSVSITSPANGAIAGAAVTITASASDNVGVTKVEFYVDDVLKATATAAPYIGNAIPISAGTHTLKAKAYDAAGNNAVSAVTNVTFPETPPVVIPDTVPPAASITAPAAGAGVTGTVAITAAASDNAAVTKVEFYIDNALKHSVTSSPYIYSWNTAAFSVGAHTIKAKAYDAAGNTGVSAAIAVTVKDSIPPSVSITAPANGAEVGAAVTITAAASDNVAVTKVEFYIDDALKYSIIGSPYIYNWDTTSASDGTHTLKAKAYDAAGNAAMSGTVAVAVTQAIQEYSGNSVTRVLRYDSASQIALNSQSGTNISLNIAANTFSADVNLTIARANSFPACDSAQTGMSGSGIGAEITLDQPLQPQKPVDIEISYNASAFPETAKTWLILARYDGALKAWLPLESISLPDLNQVTGKTKHFSVFQIMRLNPGADLADGRIYPNPFYPNRGQSQVSFDTLPSGTKVKIYTLEGELVWNGEANSSGLTVWDGRNKSGRNAASGIYMVYFENTGNKKIRKLSIIR